ncbi:MAG: XrtA/PEP-CTERM system TPR-repeat protein PrsT [Betaproteobacteria bacterium]
MPSSGRWLRWAGSAGLALLLAACGSQRDGLADAQAAVERRDMASALVHVRRALQQAPDSAAARQLLGRLLLDRGDAAGAAIELRKSLELGHDPAHVLPALADALVRQGEFREALALADAGRALPDAARAELLTALATAHFALRAEPAGEAALAEALRLAPTAVPARVLRMRRLAAARDHAGALALARETVRVAPSDPTAWLAQAQLLAGEASQRDAAIAAYRQVIELRGDALAARQGILSLLLERRELDAAASELALLRQQHPQHPATLYFETLLALHRGDATAAQGGADKLLGGAPTQARYGRLAGAVALEAGEPSRAVAQIALAQRANPADPGLRRLFALALVREGDSRQALEVLQPQLGAASTDAEALALAGVAALQLGDRAAAQAHFAKAAAHAPAGNAGLRATLALGQLAQGDVRTGVEALEALALVDAGPGVESVLVSVRIQRGEYEAAAQLLDALQRKRPDDPEVPLLRAELLRRRGDIAAARASLERALEMAPQNFRVVAALAEMDLRDRRVPQARARFEALLGQVPRHTGAMLALARIAELSGAPAQEASRWLAEAVRADPTKAALRMQQIEHALHHGQWTAALSAAADATQALPGDARLQLLLARACLAAREPQRAVAVLGKLSAGPSPSVEVMRLLARAHMALGRPDDARQALRLARRMWPADAELAGDAVRLEIGAERPDEARRIARELQQARPDDPAGHRLVGEAAVAARAWKDAEAAYAAALARSPADTAAAIGLHGVLQQAGRAAEAERLVARWLQAHPADGLFLQYLADRALRAGDDRAAVRHYRAVLRLRPGHAPSWNNLAWAEHRLGEPDALPHAQRAVALRPGEAAFVDTVARLHAAAGQWNDAVTQATRAVELAPDEPGYRLTLARFLAEAGLKDQARAELSRLEQQTLRPEMRAAVRTLRTRM